MRPAILVARAIFPEVVQRLGRYFDVHDNPGDEIYSKTELIRRLQGKVGVLTSPSVPIDDEVLHANPQLKVIANMAVGYDNLDVPACTARGVLCTNTPDVLTETTADFGFALMMSAARCIGEAERYLRDGKWAKWFYNMFLGSDIHGAMLGIFGMGRIGQAIARRAAHGFGMRVIYYNRSRLDIAIEADCRAEYVSKEQLLRNADHLIIVVPYSKESHHAIGAAELALMKSTATLTNIGRGGVVDDAALARALAERRIAAAGLDVFENEPNVHPDLLKVPNIVLTPHIASASVATRRAMAELAADNLIAGLGLGPQAGKPPTPINPEVLDA